MHICKEERRKELSNIVFLVLSGLDKSISSNRDTAKQNSSGPFVVSFYVHILSQLLDGLLFGGWI